MVGNRTGHFLHSKEGVTQVDTLAIVTYDLGVLPLIRELWTAQPSVTQTWYADEAGTGGIFTDIRKRLNKLMVGGPPRGYLPEPTKSILVMSPWYVPRVEALFWGYGIQAVMGSQHLGGFFGTETAQYW